MSRLGDTLQKALHTAPPALGFRPSQPTKPRMVLVAMLDALPDEVGSWVEGADVVMLGINIKVKELKNFGKSVPVPWGPWLDGNVQYARQADNAGADFIAFQPDKTGLEIMSSENLGKVMAVDTSFENVLLHGASELPIEAVYLRREPQNAITWLDLIQFRRLADLIAKPLLVPIAPDVSPAQLKAIWEAGVDGVVVKALAAGEIKEMRRKLDDLVLPARRKWLRARPLVPMSSPTLGLTQREEQEEEEEEED